MIEFEDIKIAERAEKYHEKRRKAKLANPAICYACKKKFSSGTLLFEHLREKPLHKTEFHWISYTIKCNKCTEFKEQGWLNIPSGHFLPTGRGTLIECQGIYVESVQITPYYRENERYSITDFDQADLLAKNGSIVP
jgi:hypothetical protein